jgi:hypothetical protein|tara:strand:- start:834 stop:1412 length:579 start_codon:yes stop_codon:yes gene_type:complete
MQSPFCFVIEPVGERYNNSVSVDNKSLIINTEIYNHEYVNRRGVVVSCPIAGKYDILPGDDVIVHHNVFRRWHDVKGQERNSKAYFKDNKYIVSADQIFLYNNKAMPGYSFVQPLVDQNNLSEDKEDPYKGVIVYSDGTYNKGEIVGYTPFSQYEFIINNQKLYRVMNKFITIKYERKGNEKTYNPSWAQGG